MKQTAAEEDAKLVAIGKADQVKRNHIAGKSGVGRDFTVSQNELMDRYHMGGARAFPTSKIFLK